jgi:hypothetical protein
MNKQYCISIAFILASVFGLETGQAQTPSPVPAVAQSKAITNRAIGEVTTLDLNASRITLKTFDGQNVSFRGDGQTTYRRIPLGETTINHAVDITFNELGIGDRIRVLFMQGTEPLLARTVLVISKSEVTQKEAGDRAEWLKRGIVGRVTALNPATKEITLLARRQERDASLVIAAQGEVNFRRYSPDSIRFSDARPGTFSEIKVGDQLRSLGEQSVDGARFKPEQIVSGSFRTVGGTITSVNAEAGEIKINDLAKQPLTIVLGHDSLLRRLSPELVIRLEDSTKNSTQGSAGGSFLNEIEKLSPISISELKPGEAVLVSCTQGSTPSRVTGIVLAAGVESFIKKRQQQQSTSGDLNLDLGLPRSVTP